jgi:quinol monooxygenase YgiN
MPPLSSSSSLPSLLMAVAVGALISYVIFGKNSNGPLFSKSAMQSRRNAVDKAFYLGVSVTFPSTEEKTKFINLFTPLAKYVKENEFGTLSYELLHSDKETNRILISERYESKDYYLNTHKTSKEFLSFREKFQEMINNGATVDGHSYIESGIGFP